MRVYKDILQKHIVFEPNSLCERELLTPKEARALARMLTRLAAQIVNPPLVPTGLNPQVPTGQGPKASGQALTAQEIEQALITFCTAKDYILEELDPPTGAWVRAPSKPQAKNASDLTGTERIHLIFDLNKREWRKYRTHLDSDQQATKLRTTSNLNLNPDVFEH